MRRALILVLTLIILVGVLPLQAFAAAGDGFATNINVTSSAEKWNTASDGSGEEYDTVIVEYRLKGEGIRGIQGAWIAVDMRKLLLVDYAYDGTSINDEIVAGRLNVGKAPIRFECADYYELKENVVSGRSTVDSWSYSMINTNLAAISKDGNTLFLCIQPSQAYSVTYDEFTTVVSLRFAVLPGAELASDTVRYITKTERNSLNQSFIVAMNDGTTGYFYGDKDGSDTLATPTVTSDILTETPTPETDERDETDPPETEPEVTDPPSTEPNDPIDTPWATPFTDVANDADYIDAIEFVYEKGLFKGVSDTKFAPDTTMTRAMFVTVMGRLAGVDPNYFTGESFDDVISGEWYAPYVKWAAQEGIVNGYGNGKFGINDPVTIEQAVVIIARYANYVGIDTASDYRLTSFIDENSVSDWAYKQMKWAVQHGIYSGNGRMLTPNTPAKRYLVAELLYAYVSVFEK